MAGVVFATLLTIVVTTTLIRTLGRAASGKADGELVLPLIGLSSITSLGLILSLTAFIAVLMVLSRLWRDSEMVVWLASGRSLLDLVKPVVQFLWPMVVGVALCSLVISPWARQQSEALRQQFETREDAKRISPGQFRESSSGQRVFFVENPDEESAQLGMVFVVTRTPDGRESVLMAAEGQFEKGPDGEPWINIRRGTRTDFSPPGPSAPLPAVRTMTFEGYRLRVDAAPGGPAIDPSVRAQPIASLVLSSDKQQRGELAFRVGLPLLCLLLGLLAIPMSVVSPRMGRSFHLLFAFLVTMTANNLLTVSQAWIAQGRVSFAMGWWPVPLVLALLMVALFWFRMGLRRGPVEWAWLGLRRLKGQG
ncbi:MAG: export transporter permease LptF [Pseudomonadota bacterium]|jgi:lipopolysaccharide export system permease protein